MSTPPVPSLRATLVVSALVALVYGIWFCPFYFFPGLNGIQYSWVNAFMAMFGCFVMSSAVLGASLYFDKNLQSFMTERTDKMALWVGRIAVGKGDSDDESGVAFLSVMIICASPLGLIVNICHFFCAVQRSIKRRVVN